MSQEVYLRGMEPFTFQHPITGADCVGLRFAVWSKNGNNSSMPHQHDEIEVSQDNFDLHYPSMENVNGFIIGRQGHEIEGRVFSIYESEMILLKLAGLS